MNELTQAAPQFLRGRMFQQDHKRPKEERILVLKAGLTARRFRFSKDEENEREKAFYPGRELILVREPDNKYDQWAVAVYLNEEDKIGYVSRYKNEIIARLMDKGKRFVAVVDDPDSEEYTIDHADEDQRTASFREAEDLRYPFSVYLIEESR